MSVGFTETDFPKALHGNLSKKDRDRRAHIVTGNFLGKIRSKEKVALSETYFFFDRIKTNFHLFFF